ncbi:MAG: PIN domain-containing protein [Alphaproteobacteria bacterium]|nr:PIN domain-containing protein [Alphaproteobacteria bacterium]MBV8409151.1 PIN domain-containing protein [Alphaproteobacteria bacterium]
MAANVLVDSSFLVALLSRREGDHAWADRQALRLPPPWLTCEAVLSETFYLLGAPRAQHLLSLLRRGALLCPYRLCDNIAAVLKLLEKYADVPMSFADACLVRMTETVNDPVLLTSDCDFRIYRRHGRQVVPCEFPR